MAVLDRSYKPYTGPRTPPTSRWAVVARDALSDVFASRFTTLVFTAAFVPPLGGAGIVYLRYNVAALEKLQIDPTQFVKIDTLFFMTILSWQSFVFGSLLALLVGPILLSKDLVNGALPLLLSRPLTKTQYVAGKFAVLAALLSVVTWVPGMILWALQAGFAGLDWVRLNWRIPIAILAGSAIWIAVLTLLALSASALAKRRVVAQALMFGTILGGAWAAGAIFLVFRTTWGNVLNLPELMRTLLFGLYDLPADQTLPPLAPWIVLPAWCALFLLVLSRRLKAKEVVR